MTTQLGMLGMLGSGRSFCNHSRASRASRAVAGAFVVALLVVSGAASAQEISYRVSFPQPEHRWMQVEVTFTGVPQQPLEIRMSRSSPGRYALHEFAKNVYDVHAFDASGREVPVTRPDPSGWNVMPAGPDVRVSYKVYGDRGDGTYLQIDLTHAHINMPAAFMWAHGLTERPIRVTFVPPPGANWKAATQLYSTADPWTFTAPNLQYFMDSPAELSAFWSDSFAANAGQSRRTFRIVLHHQGDQRAAAAYAAGIRKIVPEEGAVFGEFPEYEPGYYTFLADYVPYDSGDGMEHRNSTVMTGRGPLDLPGRRNGALDTVAHEFFHSWNVERIRPRGLEPFDFDRANMSDLLWLAEGFTSYYGPLIMTRAGLTSIDEFVSSMGSELSWVITQPARQMRSAAGMSEMAPFVDAADWIDRTNFAGTFISYYTWGAAIGLALDLSLRDRSNGAVTLDDYMRALWREYGKPGGPAPGLVGRPYSIADARNTLAEVSGSRQFADEFFSRYIEGHEVADYARLLARAGLVLRPQNPGAAWLGKLDFNGKGDGARIANLVVQGTPAYDAGLQQDDVITRLDDRHVGSSKDVDAVLAAHKPGDTIRVEFTRRSGPVTGTIALGVDPTLAIVTVESTGRALTADQAAFRKAWLASHIK